MILTSHFHVVYKKNLVTVLYFSIINVLCGAGKDASFAPQANLVPTTFAISSYLATNICFGCYWEYLKKKFWRHN